MLTVPKITDLEKMSGILTWLNRKCKSAGDRAVIRVCGVRQVCQSKEAIDNLGKETESEEVEAADEDPK